MCLTTSVTDSSVPCTSGSGPGVGERNRGQGEGGLGVTVLGDAERLRSMVTGATVRV